MESEYEKAIDYYQSALAIGEDMGDKYRVAESLADLAISYRQAGAYDDVIRVAKRGLELSKDIKVNVAQRLFYENLAATYDSLGQYKKAYEYQKLYKQIDDSIYAINNRQQVLDMEARYQNERKENEILALTNDISLQAIQLEKNRNFRIFVSVAGLLLLVLFVVFYRLYDLRLKTARILAEKNVELEIANQNLSISENALKSLNSTKDKFFTIIAHDIRNPLSAYRSITKSMVGSYNRLSEAQKLEHIESIYQSSENLYRLLDNLLHWAVSQSGALRVNPKEIDLDVVCFKTARLLQASADMKEITLACEVPEDSFAYADLNMVSTVVTNLLSNAIKFTAPQGHVNISAKEKGEQLIVSISDDGIGISAEDQLKLFKVDVDQKTIGNSIEKGSGVGLLLCKEFVEKNGGKIWVESIPGKGSTFHFSLPKMPEETSQSV
jgi:signal transduction histidine kinase